MSEWRKIKLSEVLIEKTERNKKKITDLVLSVTNSQGFVKQSDFFEGTVHSEDISNYKLVRKNEFAYNPSRINVGSVDCQQKEPYVVVSPLYTVFSVSPDLYMNYLKYFFKSRYCHNLINSRVSGSVRNNLKFDVLCTFDIPYYSRDKQQEAVKQFESIKGLINNEIRQLALLDELIKSRFNEMFVDKGFGVKPIRYFINKDKIV